MWPLSKCAHLGVHLVLDPCFDEVFGEDTTAQQKLVVFLKGLQRLEQRGGHLLDVLCLFRGQLVQVIVDWFERLYAVLDAV